MKSQDVHHLSAVFDYLLKYVRDLENQLGIRASESPIPEIVEPENASPLKTRYQDDLKVAKAVAHRGLEPAELESQKLQEEIEADRRMLE